MKTQISRDSFRPGQRYSGVFQQQGRMLTDADWNEFAAVTAEQAAQALADVIGNGAPRTGAVTVTVDRKVQPGDLYVDGIRAQLPGKAPFPASQQPDLAGYPDLPAAGPYAVYADVWERAVTALEDPGLRDAGLHGADTCTRTQTMLQVKVMTGTGNPDTDIPRCGNALLSLSLPASLEAGDPCDPCAGLISAGKGRIGNYLFRLEVHAVEGSPANPTRVVLKWSSENGAEQYQARPENEMPPEFVSADYIYEFHDTGTERRLGVFLGGGYTPVRGVLKASYEIPAAAPRDFVRRWDGYCELTRAAGAWSLAAGIDHGVALSTLSPATAPGHVSLSPSLEINLGALLLTLEISGKTFVAGDYWLAPVREAVLAPGAQVPVQPLPSGVVHHYLRLARVDASGAVQPFVDDADRRRHAFPPLTDLRASDVGYTKSCDTGIYRGKSVANVDDVLKLLCDIQAGQVSYRAGTGCSFLDQPQITTVQAALDALCARNVGGCRITVGRGGAFERLGDAIDALLARGERDIALCLLPGDHEMQGRVVGASNGKLHLAISGCGPGTRLHIAREPLSFRDLASLSLDDMEIRTTQSPRGALLFQRCHEIALRGVEVRGLVVTDSALVEVHEARSVSMESVLLEAARPDGLQHASSLLDAVPELAGLFRDTDRSAFERSLADAVARAAARDPRERMKLAAAVQQAIGRLAKRLSPRERQGYQDFMASLAGEALDAPMLMEALRRIRAEGIRKTPAVALAIGDAAADWRLLECDVLGTIVLYGIKPAGPLPSEMTAVLDRLMREQAVAFTGRGSTLRISGCRMTQVDVSDAILRRLEEVVSGRAKTLDGIFESGLLTGCGLMIPDTQLALVNANLSSVEFDVSEARAALVIADTSIYVGNRAEGATIVNVTPPVHSERAANLGLAFTT